LVIYPQSYQNARSAKHKIYFWLFISKRLSSLLEINNQKYLHLVGCNYKIILTMHGHTNIKFLNCHLNRKYILHNYILSVEKNTRVRVQIQVVWTGAVISFLGILLCAFFKFWNICCTDIYYCWFQWCLILFCNENWIYFPCINIVD